MGWVRTGLCGGLVVGLLAAGGAAAQQAAGSKLRQPVAPLRAALPGGSDPVAEELHAMSDEAGVIFEGQVLSIARHAAAGAGPGAGWVEIKFRIEDPVRGCDGQSEYVLREWAGLWDGAARYRVGERLLMLLHAPSASGLSSPVGGQDGAIPVTGAGASPAGPDDATTAETEAAVDLRWVATRVQRPEAGPSYRLHEAPARPVDGPYVTPMTSAGGGVQTASEAAATEVPQAKQSGLGMVLAMLGAWERARSHAAQ